MFIHRHLPHELRDITGCTLNLCLDLAECQFLRLAVGEKIFRQFEGLLLRRQRILRDMQ